MLSGELDMLLQAAGSVASDLDCLLTRSEFGRWLETNFSCLDFLALQDQLGIKRGLLMLYCSNVRGKGDCKAGAKHAVDGKLALKQLLDVCRRIPESKNKRRSNCQACYCDRQGKVILIPMFLSSTKSLMQVMIHQLIHTTAMHDHSSSILKMLPYLSIPL